VHYQLLTSVVAAAQSASTTSNLQAWSVVVVRDEARKARLAGLAGEQAFIGAMRDKPEAVADERRLTPGTFAAFGTSLGFPDLTESAAVKPRLPQAAVVHHETYDLDKQPAAVAAYEERMATFYAEQELAVSWIQRVLNRLAGPQSLKGRDRIREALTAQGLPSR
jgi:hypothetical protein